MKKYLTHFECDDQLKYAICAVSFMRSIHDEKPQFKNGKKYKDRKKSCATDSIRMARYFISKARASGFNGPITQHSIDEIVRGLDKVRKIS